MKPFSIFLLLIPALVFAQPAFRPIIDSTATCAFEKGSAVTRTFDPDAPDKVQETVHLDVFYIVEQMPLPGTEHDIIVRELSQLVRLNAQEKATDGTMYFQCIVNCHGKAGDFQIIQCPDGFSNVCFQVFDVIRKMLVEWHPGKQHNREVDVQTMIKVSSNQGQFKIEAPVVLPFEWQSG